MPLAMLTFFQLLWLWNEEHTKIGTGAHAETVT